MADYSDQQPVNGRYPRLIYSHRFIPQCPVHGKPMAVTSTGAIKVYFKCAEADCPHTGQAPRVEFVPKE